MDALYSPNGIRLDKNRIAILRVARLLKGTGPTPDFYERVKAIVAEAGLANPQEDPCLSLHE